MDTYDSDALAPLLASFSGTTLPAWLRDRLSDGLGGVVYFGYNTPDLDTTARLSQEVTAAADHTPVIAIDEEAGDVTRLYAKVGGPSPAARGFGEIDDLNVTRAHSEALGLVLRACGISMNFAPVADVASNPMNPVIGTRAYGSTVESVVRHAGAVCDGLHAAGILTCLKHFPGHGDTDVDSHLGIPVVEMEADAFERDHTAAFSRLADRTDAVMTGHVAVPAYGDGPASISRWSGALLAERHPNALIVTDALDMGAITDSAGFGEACVRALEAGADLLCLGTSIRRDGEQMVAEAHDAVRAALTSGRLSREDLRARASRVQAFFASAAKQADGIPAMDLSEATALFEDAGASASRLAIRWASVPTPCASGPTRVRISDARMLHDYAAGKGNAFIVPALEELGFTVTDSPSVDDASPTLTVVLTRLWTADSNETTRVHDAVEAAARAGEPIVVIHAGVPELVPAHNAPPTILSLGASRGSMTASAELLHQWCTR